MVCSSEGRLAQMVARVDFFYRLVMSHPSQILRTLQIWELPVSVSDKPVVLLKAAQHPRDRRVASSFKQLDVGSPRGRNHQRAGDQPNLRHMVHVFGRV